MSLVPESTLSRLSLLAEGPLAEVADLAMQSEKSLLESDSQARFVFPLEICLMMVSSLLVKSLFFLLKTGQHVVILAFAVAASAWALMIRLGFLLALSFEFGGVGLEIAIVFGRYVSGRRRRRRGLVGPIPAGH